MVISYGIILAVFVVNIQSLISASLLNPDHGCTYTTNETQTPSGATHESGICLSAPNGQVLPTSAVFGADILLIIIMLAGLLRMEESRHFGLARYLYRQVCNAYVLLHIHNLSSHVQGLLWMALVIIAEAPAVALSALDLNGTCTVLD